MAWQCLTGTNGTTCSQRFFPALSHRASAMFLFPDEAALARLLIGAGAIAPTERGQRGQAHRLATRSAAVHFRSGALPGKHAEGPVMTCSGGDAQLLLDIGHHRVC